MAPRLDGNPKAVLFRKPGGDGIELVGNVMGSRRRLALAFGVPESGLLQEVLTRLTTPIAPIEIPSSAAPVHQVVLTGADADFTKLPIHLQHGEDGGPYISASIDITRSIDGKKRNLGYRRMMLRGPHEAGIDLIAPSDLRALYAEYHKRKERMPVAFIVGSHPADGVAATAMNPIDDEVHLMGALRGAPVPLVRCATIDAMVPADAEVIFEGYLDENGWVGAGRPLWRVCRLLRPDQNKPGVSFDRDHDAAGCDVSDRHDRRPHARLYRHRPALRASHRGCGMVRPANRDPRAGRRLCHAVLRRHA